MTRGSYDINLGILNNFGPRSIDCATFYDRRIISRKHVPRFRQHPPPSADSLEVRFHIAARTRKFSKFSKTLYIAAEQGFSLENKVKTYFFACGAPQNTFFLSFCISTKFFISENKFYTIFLLKNLKINMVFIKNTWSGASYIPATNTKFSKFSASVIYTDRHIYRLPSVQ